MSVLSDRLRRVKESGALERRERAPGADALPPAGSSGFAVPPGGWEEVDHHVWSRTTCFDVELPDVLPRSPLLPSDTPADRLCFLDTETTGLSSGAGTVAFLVGIGRVTGRRLSVEQVFLSDFPGEPAFLRRLRERLPPDAVYVSYNGKAFDVPLLKGRFALYGVPFSFGEQLDLLFPARRLWASLIGSCALSEVERRVLGVARLLDVPGALVPDIYFAYLRSGESEGIDRVFAHHVQDIVSLQMLLGHMDAIIRDPLRRFVDTVQLARWMLSVGDPRAEALLESETASGNGDAAMLLARLRKRQRRWAEAEALWLRAWRDRRSAAAALELAKYYEHHVRNYSLALSFVEPLLSAASEDQPARRRRVGVPARRDPRPLRHRLERLRGKCARAG